YTKFVLFSKWFLGVFAIVLMSSLIAWPLLTKDRSGIRITFMGTGNPNNAASPVMEHPQYEGSDAKGQQFKVTGIRATQKTPELVLIEKVDGQLIRANGGWSSLNADTAEYRQKQNHLELIGNVVISSDTGYIFNTPRASVDTKTMHITGNEA